MVTTNIDTDLDITNGTHGVISQVILYPQEPPIGYDPIIHLHNLPSYILVKLNCTHAPQLDGLDDGVIPVEPTTQTLQIKIPSAQQKIVNRSMK
jgi:hypothetical protein